jgi:ankyrin repeat protein
VDVYETLLDACPQDGVLTYEVPNYILGNRHTVLHRACEYGAPFDVFRMLLTRYPDAIRFKQDDEERDTALHVAVGFGKVSVEIVELLIDACPKNLMEKNVRGETPLFCVAVNRRAPSDIIKLLLNRCPQAVRMKDSHGDYLLHIITIPDLVSHVYNLYPKAIRQLNDVGDTPLHLACCDGGTYLHLRFFVEHFSAACLTLNNDDQSPYDMALQDDEELGDELVVSYMATATKDARVQCSNVFCTQRAPHRSLLSSISAKPLRIFFLLPKRSTVWTTNVLRNSCDHSWTKK